MAARLSPAASKALRALEAEQTKHEATRAKLTIATAANEKLTAALAQHETDNNARAAGESEIGVLRHSLSLANMEVTFLRSMFNRLVQAGIVDATFQATR